MAAVLIKRHRGSSHFSIVGGWQCPYSGSNYSVGTKPAFMTSPHYKSKGLLATLDQGQLRPSTTHICWARASPNLSGHQSASHMEWLKTFKVKLCKNHVRPDCKGCTDRPCMLVLVMHDLSIHFHPAGARNQRRPGVEAR